MYDSVYSKNQIATNAALFQSALKSVNAQTTPQQAYLMFNKIGGAGINAITETLHTIDNKRFAVMNQNSVAGMNRANYFFPNKITGMVYQNFCKNAQAVCKALKLKNFTELNALLNYA